MLNVFVRKSESVFFQKKHNINQCFLRASVTSLVYLTMLIFADIFIMLTYINTLLTLSIIELITKNYSIFQYRCMLFFSNWKYAVRLNPCNIVKLMRKKRKNRFSSIKKTTPLSLVNYTGSALSDVIESKAEKSVNNENSDTSLEPLSNWVINEIEKNKIYLDNTLTLDNLANRLDLKPYILSECLNKGVGQSYYQFVNGYRVKTAKEMLTTEPQMTITDIYEFCGFSSRSTFYSLFKKHVGCTPSDYRKNNVNTGKLNHVIDQ